MALATLGGIMLAGAALVATPGLVRADCAVDDDACIQVDATVGVPGARVTMNPFGPGCEPGARNRVEFVDGPYDEARSYPSSPLTVTLRGEVRVATFVVPAVPAGSYSVALRCDADLPPDPPDNPYGLLPFVFTVLEPPATDTLAEAAGGEPPVALLFLVALGAGLAVAGVLRPPTHTDKRSLRR
jgi:hypothetical protein